MVKIPVTDGLPPDFSKFVWIYIKSAPLERILYSISVGELSIEQKRGFITHLPKKDKSRHILNNWRPISFLNTDYKIIAKLLKNRFKKVLPRLINNDKTC